MGDLLQIIENIQNLLPNFLTLTFGLAALIGLYLIGSAIIAARRETDRAGHQGGGWSGAMAKLIIGSFLLAFPGLLTVLSTSFFSAPETDVSTVFSHAPELANVWDQQGSRQSLLAILSVIQFFGVIAVVRGLLLLNANFQSIGSRPTFGSGMTHVIGGIAAVNIPLVIGLFEALGSPGGVVGGG